MYKSSRFALALGAIVAVSACREAQMPLPAAPSADLSKQVDMGPPPPQKIDVDSGGICNIEAIGDVTGTALDVPVVVAGETTVSGWRTSPKVDGTEAPAWLRVVGGDGAVKWQGPLPATEDRPDVSKAYNRATALHSGFRQVAVTGLSKGTYTMEVTLNLGPRWVRCAHTRTIEVK